MRCWNAVSCVSGWAMRLVPERIGNGRAESIRTARRPTWRSRTCRCWRLGRCSSSCVAIGGNPRSDSRRNSIQSPRNNRRMIDKFIPGGAAALAGIADGAVVLLPGFGNGMPETLVTGLLAQGARDLTLVVNSGGRETGPTADILASGRVRKLVCSFVRADSVAGRQYAAGKLK